MYFLVSSSILQSGLEVSNVSINDKTDGLDDQSNGKQHSQFFEVK